MRSIKDVSLEYEVLEFKGADQNYSVTEKISYYSEDGSDLTQFMKHDYPHKALFLNSETQVPVLGEES